MADSLIQLIATIKDDNDRLLLILEETSGGKYMDDQLAAKLSEAVKQAHRCKGHLSKLKIPFEVEGEINENRSKKASEAQGNCCKSLNSEKKQSGADGCKKTL